MEEYLKLYHYQGILIEGRLPQTLEDNIPNTLGVKVIGFISRFYQGRTLSNQVEYISRETMGYV